MKPWRIALMLTLLLLTLCWPRLLAEDKPALKVNGELLGTDVAPVIENGRALVPIRVISEALGFAVSWDPERRSVIVAGDNRRLAMTIDKLDATVDSQVVSLDVPARIIEGRTFVPLRFAGTALGADVAWDNVSRTVSANRAIPISLSEVEQSATQLSVTIRGPAPLHYDKKIEVNPSRLLLDLPFAKTPQDAQTIPVNKAGIIAVRSSQREDDPSTARIAFDLDGKTAEKVEVQPSADGRQIKISVPYRITQINDTGAASGEEITLSFDGPVQMMAAAAPTQQTGMINTDNVNFRPGPGMSYPPFASLMAGTKATVLNIQTGWVNVKLGDQRTGWVSQALITLDPVGAVGSGPITELNGTGQRLEIQLQGVQPILPSFSRWPQSQLDTISLEPNGGPSAKLVVVFKESVRYKVVCDGGKLMIQLNSNKSLLSVTTDSKSGGTLLRVKLNGPVQYQVSHLSQPERLLIEIPSVDQGDVSTAIAVNDGLVNGIRIRSEGSRVLIIADLSYYIGHSVRSAGTASQIEINLITAGLNGKFIVLDPGHGGSDPGAVGVTKFFEKTATLDIAQKLKALLEKAGAKVVLTRGDDRYVELSTRADMANSGQADLFLSIHHNSATRPEANGLEVLYATGDDRQRLADCVQKELVSALGLRNRGIISRPEIYVTRETEMTSALAEIGFVSNPTEEAMLKDVPFRQKAAQALFNGLASYFAK